MKHRQTPAVLPVLGAPPQGSGFLALSARTIHRGQRPTRKLVIAILMGAISSFVEMIKCAATSFPFSVYHSLAVPANNLPGLDINLWGANVSLGGNAANVYRTSGDECGGTSGRYEG